MKFKHLLTGLLFTTLFFVGCAEKEPIHEPTIEGIWHRDVADMQVVYEFRETGALTVQCVSFGEVLYTNHYAYAVADGVLTLHDYEEETFTHYELDFPTDTTATLDLPRKMGLTLKLVRF